MSINNDVYNIIRQMPSTLEDNNMHIYNDNEMSNTKKDDLLNMMVSEKNVNYLTQMIIGRSSMNGSYDRQLVESQVKKYLKSWEAMGKFDTIQYRYVNLIAALDAYNKEFVDTFASTIIPENIFDIKSVINPNGMYAQQERILKTTSKPVPFYERAIFKRLTDRELVHPISETQNLFYGMDDVNDLRYKVTYDQDELSDYREKVNFSYNSLPNY